MISFHLILGAETLGSSLMACISGLEPDSRSFSNSALVESNVLFSRLISRSLSLISSRASISDLFGHPMTSPSSIHSKKLHFSLGRDFLEKKEKQKTDVLNNKEYIKITFFFGANESLTNLLVLIVQMNRL